MRAIKPNAGRWSPWQAVLLSGLAVVLGGAGTVAALAYLKVIDPAKLAFWRNGRSHPDGWIAVPISPRPIPAYTRVTGHYLTDPKTGELAVVYMPPQAIPKDAILNILKIRDRVLAQDKPALYYFKESDFLPEGSRPGIAGGTPEGKRAITLDASKLKGVHDLAAGDHVDLLASVEVDMPGAGRSTTGRVATTILATPNTTLVPKRSVVRPLVQDGVVVMPVRTRAVPISSSSLTQGTTTRTVPVQEIVVAVAPEEVAPLAEALDLNYEITCVVRSGRPMSQAQSAGRSAPASQAASPLGETRGNNGDTAIQAGVTRDLTPGLDPLSETRFMEFMVGGQRQFVLFTGPGNSPVVAWQEQGGSANAGSGVVAAGDTQEGRQ